RSRRTRSASSSRASDRPRARGSAQQLVCRIEDDRAVPVTRDDAADGHAATRGEPGDLATPQEHGHHLSPAVTQRDLERGRPGARDDADGAHFPSYANGTPGYEVVHRREMARVAILRELLAVDLVDGLREPFDHFLERHRDLGSRTPAGTANHRNRSRILTPPWT